MDEEINKLEYLLKDLMRQIENHLFIESKGFDNLNETMLSWKKRGLSKTHVDAFSEYISNEKSTVNNNLFYNDKIPKIKLLLSSALENINLITQDKETKNSNIGIDIFTPNQEFKALIKTGLIKQGQEIFGAFKKQTFWGHLTPEGFFNLIIKRENVMCSDFKYAIWIAWKKEVPNDGWRVWSTIDYKTEKTKPLTYFRNQLRKFN